jgi:hypothetical protein
MRLPVNYSQNRWMKASKYYKEKVAQGLENRKRPVLLSLKGIRISLFRVKGYP